MQENSNFFKVLKVRVIPMKVRESEARLKEFILTQSHVDGFLGAVFLNAGLSGMFMVCLRFSGREELQRWENSSGNRELHNLLENEKAVILSEDFYDAHEYSNEFSASAGEITLKRQTAIPAYKMALIVWLSVFPLVAFVLPPFGRMLQTFMPGLASVMLSTILMVLLLVFVLNPLLIRLFGFWLKK